MSANKKSNGVKWLFWASVIFILLPIASLLLSNVLANLFDCNTAYAGEESCRIGGQFMGDTVYNMFTFGWAAFFSIPIGLVGIIIAAAIFGFKKVKK